MPIEIFQQWIEKAQDESASKIIVGICDANVDTVQILITGKANTGTPKDLVGCWCIPKLLHKQAIIAKTQLSTWCP
jgi:hypothetical protein